MSGDLELSGDFEEAVATKLEDALAVGPEFVVLRRRHWAVPGESIFYDRKEAEIARLNLDGRDKLGMIQALQDVICDDLFTQQQRIKDKGRDPYLMSYSVSVPGLEDYLSAGVSFTERGSNGKIVRMRAKMLIEKALLEDDGFVDGEIELDDDAPMNGLFNYLWHVWGYEESEQQEPDPIQVRAFT
ncbi:MAG: hypothetical protein WC043_01155 [Pseudobdellovibrionaceae bacterium]